MNSTQELTYQDLNNGLHDSLLDTWFFDSWRHAKDQHKHLELMVTNRCNLACEYCYITKNGSTLFPPQVRNITTIKNNIIKILTWLGENSMAPNLDIFTGELFCSEEGYQILDTILNFYRKNFDKYKKPFLIVIPSNFAFLDNGAENLRIQDYIHYFEEVGISLKLSASFDGLYADKIARVHRSGIERTQAWYDRCFSFMKHQQFYPHPMIAPSTIHIWKENFLWFVDMFKKYDMNIEDLYLLEVRNANWTKQNLADYEDFCKFILDWLWDYYNHDKDVFLKNFFPDGDNHITGAFNFLGGPFDNPGECAKCTIQNYMFVRVGDLKLFPCHRLAYPHLELAQMHLSDNGELKLESKNIELANAIYSFSPNKLPMCHKCAIKNLCGTQCYGSCFETTGDMFNPIPSVCALNATRIKVTAEKLKEYGIFMDFVNELEQTQANQLMVFVGGENGE